MFIITHKKELSIWTTETPFQKKSGIWHFYDSIEEYEDDLAYFIDKYSNKFMFTLDKIMKLYKDRGETDTDEQRDNTK